MKFSIIVPVYNAENYLTACIDSVRAQQFLDWEMILVDDGSVDRSGEMLNYVAEEDSRIHVLHQKNLGQFFARQRGIEAAVGNYILFLDSDDMLEPECLKILDTYIEEIQPDILMYTGQIFNGDIYTGQNIGMIYPTSREVSVQWLREKLISTDELNSLCLKAIRRELFCGDVTDYSRLLGKHRGEDKVRLMYPLSKANCIFYIPFSLYRYNIRSGSVMHQSGVQNIQQMMMDEVFSLLEQFMQNWEMTDRKYREMLQIYSTKNYISAYCKLRRNCRTMPEWTALRQYHWEKYIKKTTFRVFCKLNIKEKLRFFATALRL